VRTSVKLLRGNDFQMQRGAADTQKFFEANLLMLYFCFTARCLPTRAAFNTDHESLDLYTPSNAYPFVDVVSDMGTHILNGRNCSVASNTADILRGEGLPLCK
jgi:hypothetical protein